MWSIRTQDSLPTGPAEWEVSDEVVEASTTGMRRIGTAALRPIPYIP